MKHSLKILPEFFKPVLYRTKTFEIRSELDRTFNVGDTLLLKEWNADLQLYTNDSVSAVVTYVLRDETYLQKDFCCMGIKLTEFTFGPNSEHSDEFLQSRETANNIIG